MIFSTGVIKGDYNGQFKGWAFINSKIDFDGEIDVEYENGHDDICKKIMTFEKTQLSMLTTSSDRSQSTLVLDTSKTGLYSCYNYNFKEIYTLQDCKVKGYHITIPDDVKCLCTSKYCNYIVEGKHIKLTNTIGGIEGTDMSIYGENIHIETLKCQGNCSLSGEVSITTMNQLNGNLHIIGIITIRSFTTHPTKSTIIMEQLSNLIIKTDVIANTNIHVGN